MDTGNALGEFLTPTRRGPRCGVATALDKLSDQDRQLIADAIAHPEASSRRIAIGIATRLGAPGPTHATVARHRRGDCRCPRPADD